MCGIAGWYDRNLDLRTAVDIISGMSESLKRRGPDDSGIMTERTVLGFTGYTGYALLRSSSDM